MKTWKEANITVLDFTETAGHDSHGNGNTAGGTTGGNGNGKKLNEQWTEAQKNGNTTFWGGPDTKNNLVDGGSL